MSDLILYTTEDGQTRLNLRADGLTVWLSQLEIAELFQTTKHNISIHTKNIFQEGELAPEATVKESLTVQTEGRRQVERTISYYNLDLIVRQVILGDDDVLLADARAAPVRQRHVRLVRSARFTISSAAVFPVAAKCSLFWTSAKNRCVSCSRIL